jgi:hypothetical protein
MTAFGHRIALLSSVFLLMTLPVSAQTQDERITQLEKKLDELQRLADQVRLELNSLKGAPAEEDLTAVEVLPAPIAAPAAAPAPPALTDVQPLDNQIAPGASKVFNPDIAVIGNFLGHAGDRNEFQERDPLILDEAEMSLEAFIDPYAKARFFFAFGPEGVEIEEGYANFLTLPWDLTAKAGKMKALFGKDNTWHTHQRPWIDQPLVIQNFFGEEGLADFGVSVSKAIANPMNAFIEATGEVYSGNAEGVFERESANDLFYNAHLKFFRDLSENSNIELGTSYARGHLPAGEETPGGSNQFAGVDVTYRWRPLATPYRSWIARFEGIVNDRPDLDDRLLGFYASADYQLARRWFAGVRFDRADRDVFTDKGASATLTFWPSEFSQIRGQLRRLDYGGARTVNEFLLQLQFAIGAHGAHVF